MNNEKQQHVEMSKQILSLIKSRNAIGDCWACRLLQGAWSITEILNDGIENARAHGDMKLAKDLEKAMKGINKIVQRGVLC